MHAIIHEGSYTSSTVVTVQIRHKTLFVLFQQIDVRRRSHCIDGGKEDFSLMNVVEAGTRRNQKLSKEQEVIIMFKHWYFALWSCSLLLLLVACGNTSGSDTQASDNSSSDTQTNGHVSIATDHSVYQPSDHIQATVLNRLSTPIYALDTQEWQ